MSDAAYALFRQALEAEDREAFLATCGNLREQVEEYLKLAEDVDDGFLAKPAGEQLTIATFSEGDKVGRFTIGRLIASGGAGAVYEAEQDEPRRTVAVKIMRIGFSPERFREEAQVLARLDHPDIAHVYEAGVHDGVPYIAMEYVVGAATLAEHCKSLNRNERLELFARVCDAVHHGHIKGVVHRDIKPANILVRETGPKVIDFGIAQVEGAATGEIAGTLAYMSPEQCAGEDVDARSDVYSLGAVLHELVSGSPPHDVASSSIPEAIAVIRHAPAPELGGDLGAVVAKALAKDRIARYDSAAALADDVRRVLRAEPIRARHASLWHQFTLLARRRTAVLAIGMALLAAIVAGVWVSLRFAFRADAAREDALEQAYQANIVGAASALRVHDVARARAQLERAPPEMRGWEWHYLNNQLDLSTETRIWENRHIYSGAVAPKARRYAATSHWGVRVWDEDGKALYTIPRGDRELPMSCALSTDGKRLAVGYSRGFAFYDVDRREVLYRYPTLDHPKVWSIAFAPDNRTVAVGGVDGLVRLWDVTGRGRDLHRFPTRIMSLAFSPDGKWLYSGTESGRVHRVHIAKGTIALSSMRHDNNVESLAVGPEGKLLASCSMDGTVVLTDTKNMAAMAEHAPGRQGFKTVAFSPDGKTYAAGGLDNLIRVWRVSDGEEVAVLHGHRNHVRALGYFAENELLSFGRSDAIKLWSARASTTELAGLDAEVRHLTLLPGKVAATSQSGRICVWDEESGRILDTRAPKGISAVVDEETFLLIKPPEQYTEVRGPVIRRRLSDGADLATLAQFDVLSRQTFQHMEIAGDVVVLASVRGRVAVRSLRDGGIQTDWNVDGVSRLALSDDGLLVAIWRNERQVQIRRVGDGAEMASLPKAKGYYSAFTFRGDNDVLAIGAVAGDIMLWDIESGEALRTLEGHGAKVNDLAYSPDGTRLASASSDGTVRVWDPERGVELLVLPGHRLYVTCVKWSTDGKTLYSGGGGVTQKDCMVRVWRSENR